MRVYMTRHQAEQVIVALMTVFGSQDEDSLKTINIKNINNVLLLQCKRDKSHFNKRIEKMKVG